MSIDTGPKAPTYAECVLMGFCVIIQWMLVIITLPIALPLAAIGYWALRSEDRDA